MTEASSIMPERVPLFERLCVATVEKCRELFTRRGDQYGDTWLHCSWTKLRAVVFTTRGIKLSKDECRAYALAAYADMKYWRNLGGYNPDHIRDGINYDAALDATMTEIYKQAGEPRHTYD